MKKVKNSLILFSFLLIGLFIFFYPILFSGFELMPGWNSDSRLIAYIFEHSWNWLTNTSITNSLWDMPFMYPHKNTLAISDTFIGVMPFYWIFRSFIKNPFTVLQILYVLFSVFNYFTFYCLLKKQLKFSTLASSFGAFIFAFSLMRYYRLGHFQFFTQFYSILSLIFLINTFSENCNKIFNFSLASLFLILQFYTAYLFGFYYVFVLFFIVIFCLFFKEYQKKILEYFKNNIKYILFFELISLLLLLPLALHYLQLGQTRSLNDVVLNLTNQNAWIKSVSVLDNLFIKNNYSLSLIVNEYACSIGIIATIVSLIGLWLYKNYSKICYFTLLFTFINSCSIGYIVIWPIFYYIFPGASGVRCIIRISFIALIVLVIGISKFIDSVKFKNKVLANTLVVFMILLMLVEHIPYLKDINSNWIAYGWSKREFIQRIENIKTSLPKECKVLFMEYIPMNDKKIQEIDYALVRLREEEDITAMWSSLIAKKYTINAYSGVEFNDNNKLLNYCHVKIPFDMTKIR